MVQLGQLGQVGSEVVEKRLPVGGATLGVANAVELKPDSAQAQLGQPVPGDRDDLGICLLYTSRCV